MGRIQEEFRSSGLEVIAIDIQPGRDGMAGWIDYWHSKKGGDVTWAQDEKFELVKQFRVLALGQTVIIDSGGKMIYNGLPPGYERLKALVEGAI